MKNIIIVLLCMRAFTVFAQDSTKVVNVSLQARIIEYFANVMKDPANDDRFTVFLKWRTALRSTKATGTAAVLTDTIPTVVLADMYDIALASEEGFGVAALLKTQIAAKRAANSYLNRLCTNIEDAYTAILTRRRLDGRKLLLGK